MRPSKTGPRERLNLEVSADVRARILALRDQTNADSISEVVRRALATYEKLVSEVRAGGVVSIERGGVRRELVLAPEATVAHVVTASGSSAISPATYEAVERASVEDDEREAVEGDASIRELHAAAGLKTFKCEHGLFVEGAECGACERATLAKALKERLDARDAPVAPVALPSRRRSFDEVLAERLRNRNALK